MASAPSLAHLKELSDCGYFPLTRTQRAAQSLRQQGALFSTRIKHPPPLPLQSRVTLQINSRAREAAHPFIVRFTQAADCCFSLEKWRRVRGSQRVSSHTSWLCRGTETRSPVSAGGKNRGRAWKTGWDMFVLKVKKCNVIRLFSRKRCQWYA